MLQRVKRFLFGKLFKYELAAIDRQFTFADSISKMAQKTIKEVNEKPPVLIRAEIFGDSDPAYLYKLSEISKDPMFEYFLMQIREVHIAEFKDLGRSGDVAKFNNLAGRLQQIEEIRFLLATREVEYKKNEELKKETQNV